MKRIIRFTYSILVLLLMCTTGCTKLDETSYSNVLAENYYNNKTEVTSVVLRPYTHIGASIGSWGGQKTYWRINELSADQLAIPQKGIHWYNNGDFVRLHGHTWTTVEDHTKIPFTLLYTGIGFCNNTIEEISQLTTAKTGMTQAELDAAVAETKVLRAYQYMKLMDLYGNIPIVTAVGTPLSPPTVPRAEVFKFIEAELKENVEKLPPLSQSFVGRVTKAGGYAILAELYLNAELWSGTQRWDDCISACDKIIGGQAGGLNGAPGLDADIKTAFSNTNDKSKEVLFSIAYDFVKTAYRAQWNSDLWHYNQKEVYDATHPGNSNNGIVVTPNAYDAYKNNDLRKSTWMLIGPQFKFGTTTPVQGTQEYKGKPLVFVKEISRNSEGKTQSDMTQGEENSGARFNKYLPGRTNDPNFWGNDWVLYRLTEIHFNKAEALIRKNGGVADATAVQLINDSKKRAFSASDWLTEAYTPATLTLDELLAERGREFIFEGKRRTDLIRFGKFTTATWWDHQPTPKTRELFPIPYTQIAVNPNLVQNPGY